MKKQRLVAWAAIVVGSAALAWAADAVGGVTGVEELELRLLDLRQQSTAETFQDVPERTRETDIVLVLFGEVTVMDPVFGWGWIQPANRQHIADVIRAVSAAGARTVGLDVYLDRLYPNLGGDDALAEAIEEAGNVILVSPVTPTDSGPVATPPRPEFAGVAADVGTAELPASFETFRLGTLAARSAGSLEPSFALAMYAHFRGLDVDSLLLEARARGRVDLPGLPASVGSVPEHWFEAGTSDQSTLVTFPIRFVGPPSSVDRPWPPGTFPVVESAFVPDLAPLMPQMFQDRIVLIGTGFHNEDKFRTPFYTYPTPPDTATGEGSGQYGYMFGVEVHANALQNMLDGEYVTPLPRAAVVLLLLLAAAVAAALTFWKGTTWGAAGTVVALTGVVVYAWWAWAGVAWVPGGELFHFSRRFLWVPVVTPVLAGVFGYFSTVGYVAVVEGKEKRFIKSAFSKYVSPDVVADLANNPQQLQLGGQKRELSLFFSDLAGFTTLSERLDPQDLLAKLNDYLTEMTQIVLDERGTLDKYIGDAIMAFWNAPRDVPDHAERALRTMVLTQRKMAELNARWRAADPNHEELIVRIGVNTGVVVVGNVGGENRFDYSAIGDAVNLAARLEPANKSYDTLNMCSEFTLAQAGEGKFRVRELDLIAVKGKEEPVRVYEVLEFAGVDLGEAKEAALAAYDEGMAAYRKRDWAEARQHFLRGLEACPDDGPCRVYAERCAEHIAHPPPPDWDFVVRRTVK